MNRLHHLKQTLPQNILDNSSNSNIEFIVLDYSSSDGLSDWIKYEMAEYIDNGLLVYYRYEEAKYFDRSHSRNMMFKLSTGDIICNVDADNYLGLNFSDYVNKTFDSNNNIFLIPDTKKRFYYIRDVLGRICIWKKDFISISGYDEKMRGYGFEDEDLYQRMEEIGKKESVIKDFNFLKAIRHSNDDRVSNEFFSKNFRSLYISYLSPFKSETIIFFNDGTFYKGSISPNLTNSPSPLILESIRWETGNWKEEHIKLSLNYKDFTDTINLEQDKNIFLYKESVFYKIYDPAFLNRILYELPLVTNYGEFLYNKQQRKKINVKGFGKGIVFKNFIPNEIEIY